MQSAFTVTPTMTAWVTTNLAAVSRIDGSKHPLPYTRVELKIAYKWTADQLVPTQRNIVATLAYGVPSKWRRQSDDAYECELVFTDKVVFRLKKTANENLVWTLIIHDFQPPPNVAAADAAERAADNWTFTVTGDGGNIVLNLHGTRLADRGPVVVGKSPQTFDAFHSASFDCVELGPPAIQFSLPQSTPHPMAALVSRWERRLFTANNVAVDVPIEDKRFTVRVRYRAETLTGNGEVVLTETSRDVRVDEWRIVTDTVIERDVVLLFDIGMVHGRFRLGGFTWHLRLNQSLTTETDEPFIQVTGTDAGLREKDAHVQYRQWWDRRPSLGRTARWGAPTFKMIPLEVSMAPTEPLPSARVEPRFAVWIRRVCEMLMMTPMTTALPSECRSFKVWIRYTIPGDAMGERERSYQFTYSGHRTTRSNGSNHFAFEFQNEGVGQLVVQCTPQTRAVGWYLYLTGRLDGPILFVVGRGGSVTAPSSLSPINPLAVVNGVRHRPSTFRVDVGYDPTHRPFEWDTPLAWRRSVLLLSVLPTSHYVAPPPRFEVPELPLPDFTTEPARTFSRLYWSVVYTRPPAEIDAASSVFSLKWRWEEEEGSPVMQATRPVRFVTMRYVSSDRLNDMDGLHPFDHIDYASDIAYVARFGVELRDLTHRTRLTMWVGRSGVFGWRLVSYPGGSSANWEGERAPTFVTKGTQHLDIHETGVDLTAYSDAVDAQTRQSAALADENDDVYARRLTRQTFHAVTLEFDPTVPPPQPHYVRPEFFDWVVALYRHGTFGSPSEAERAVAAAAFARISVVFQYSKTENDALRPLTEARTHVFNLDRIERVEGRSAVEAFYTPWVRVMVESKLNGGPEAFRWSISVARCAPNSPDGPPFTFTASGSTDSHTRYVKVQELSNEDEDDEEGEELAAFTPNRSNFGLRTVPIPPPVEEAEPDPVAQRQQAERMAAFRLTQERMKRMRVEEESTSSSSSSSSSEFEACAICQMPCDPRDESTPFFAFHPHGTKHYTHIGCIVPTMTAPLPGWSDGTMGEDDQDGMTRFRNGHYFAATCPVCRAPLISPTVCPTFVCDVLRYVAERDTIPRREHVLSEATALFAREYDAIQVGGEAARLDAVRICVLLETHRPALAISSNTALHALNMAETALADTDLARRWTLYHVAKLLRHMHASMNMSEWTELDDFTTRVLQVMGGARMVFETITESLTSERRNDESLDEMREDLDDRLRVALTAVGVPAEVTNSRLHPRIPDGMWGLIATAGHQILHFVDTYGVADEEDARSISFALEWAQTLLECNVDDATPQELRDSPGMDVLIWAAQGVARWLSALRRFGYVNVPLELATSIETRLWKLVRRAVAWNDRTSVAFKALWRSKFVSTPMGLNLGGEGEGGGAGGGDDELSRFRSPLFALAARPREGLFDGLTLLRELTWDDYDDTVELEDHFDSLGNFNDANIEWRALVRSVPPREAAESILPEALETLEDSLPIVPVRPSSFVEGTEYAKFLRFRIWAIEFLKLSIEDMTRNVVTLEFGYDLATEYMGEDAPRSYMGQTLYVDEFDVFRVRKQTFKFLVTENEYQDGENVSHDRLVFLSAHEEAGAWVYDAYPTCVEVEIRRGHDSTYDEDGDSDDEDNDDVEDEEDAEGLYTVRKGVHVMIHRYPSAAEMREWHADALPEVRDERRDGVGKILRITSKEQDEQYNGSVELSFRHPTTEAAETEGNAEGVALQRDAYDKYVARATQYSTELAAYLAGTGDLPNYDVTPDGALQMSDMYRAYVAVVGDAPCLNYTVPYRQGIAR